MASVGKRPFAQLQVNTQGRPSLAAGRVVKPDTSSTTGKPRKSMAPSAAIKHDTRQSLAARPSLGGAALTGRYVNCVNPFSFVCFDCPRARALSLSMCMRFCF
jgi:hypothetical protein